MRYHHHQDLFEVAYIFVQIAILTLFCVTVHLCVCRCECVWILWNVWLCLSMAWSHVGIVQPLNRHLWWKWYFLLIFLVGELKVWGMVSVKHMCVCWMTAERAMTWTERAFAWCCVLYACYSYRHLLGFLSYIMCFEVCICVCVK